jgi:pimeloyl-ACP methyl ester carboxylesterase
MFERFTPEARRVIVLAQEEARRLNHDYIGTEHLLLALVRDDDATAVQALGIASQDVRGAVEQIICVGTRAQTGHIPFTPPAKSALQQALREALQLGHSYIGTKHILLGLIAAADGDGSKVLSSLSGSTSDELRRDVLTYLANHPSADWASEQAGGASVTLTSRGIAAEPGPHRRLVDIGDRVVCARVRGSGPMVVLEGPGGGEGTTGAYGGLEERLVDFATVLTYDRAGSGRSDGPAHRRVAEIADDLDALIRAMGCAVPVVVVGWSSGGSVAEMFAVRHPDKVAGLVLLDPSEMPTESRVGQNLLMAFGIIQTLVSSLAVKSGFVRTRAGRSVLRRIATAASASTEGRDYVEHAMLNPPRARWSFVPVLPLIFGGYIRETAAALRAATLPDVPVRVLVPQTRRGGPRSWIRHIDAAHRALAQRFPQGELVPVDGASHLLPIDRPDVVIETVREMLGLSPTT